MRHISIFLMIILNLLIIPNIFATNAQVKKTFIVGVQSNNEFPLYNFNPKVGFEGIFKKFFDDFAEEEGIKFIYKTLPKNKMLKSFLSGDIDFRFPDNPFWSSAVKRSKNIVYSSSIYYYIEGVFTKKEQNFSGLDQMKSLGIVGEVVPWSLHHYIEARKITITKSDNCKLLIKELIDGDIEGAYCNYHVANYYIAKFGLQDKIIFAENLPNVDDYYYLATIKHPDLLERFNLWLEKNRVNLTAEYKKFARSN
jgi:polar amino acid transport system substrate-binding protein